MRSSWSRQVWEWSLPDGAMLKIEFESKVYDAFQGREICYGMALTISVSNLVLMNTLMLVVIISVVMS